MSTDAERQAHAAGELDEAAAMRRDGPQPAEDLERALAEVDRLLAADEYPDVLGAAIREHWPAIRAALGERRELRKALEELVRGSGLLALSEYWAAVSQAKALLAQLAPGGGDPSGSYGNP